jgi:hypothetical protein
LNFQLIKADVIILFLMSFTDQDKIHALKDRLPKGAMLHQHMIPPNCTTTTTAAPSAASTTTALTTPSTPPPYYG